MFSDLCRGIEISLTERRPPAASSFCCERHIKAERFQNLDRSNSDVLLVITHKRIVPNNHFATVVAAIVDRGAGVSDPGYRMSREPTIEAFTRVTRQGTFRGEAEGFCLQQPEWPEIQVCIWKRCNGATHSGKHIDG